MRPDARALALVTVLVFISNPHAEPVRAEWKQKITVPAVAPRPEDVRTIDGIMTAFYEVISGPAGAPRQWGRDRTLYLPGARFAYIEPTPTGVAIVNVDHQGYVEKTNADFVGKGFFEREIHRVTKVYGHMAHVFSTYESRRTPDGPVFSRGVNSVQLLHDGSRWWIAGAIWEDETEDNPLPKEFLP